MNQLVQHEGGCHCGAVRFRVAAPPRLEVHRCNCSICRACGFLHLIVPKDRFTLLSDESALTEYRFNTGQARHLFCTTCGIKSFYVPRSNPDGISVNASCLDPETIEHIEIEDFDGQNWEDNAGNLAHLSRSD